MPPLVIDDTVQLRLIWSFDNTDWAVNVLHFQRATATVNQTFADDLAALIATGFGESALNLSMVNNVRLQRIGVRDIDIANQAEFLGEINSAGQNTADPLPLMTAYCCTLRTALAGRSFRGRAYIGGFGEDSSDALGNPVAAVRDRCLSFLNDINNEITTFVPGSTGLVVASRKLLSSLGVTAVVGRDLVWDTQRRRVVPGI